MANNDTGNVVKMVLLVLVGLVLTFLFIGSASLSCVGSSSKKSIENYHEKSSSKKAEEEERQKKMPVPVPSSGRAGCE